MLFSLPFGCAFGAKSDGTIIFFLTHEPAALRHQPEPKRKLVGVETINEQPAGRLRRVLTLWDLVLYGIVLISPIAAVPLFGIVQQLSGGVAVSTLLVAMVAMILTAFSYGRMAALHPLAGSAYSYVGRGLNPHLGFLAGWAMLLDYLLVPVICTVYTAITLERVVPGVPYWIWCALIAVLITGINLWGIRATATANMVMMIAALAVILPFIGLAIRWLLLREGWHGLFSTQPFYNPQTFHWNSLAAGTALAALTYGGFDGVSTLSEEVENPRRNILLATVFVCIFTGVFGGLQIYLAQRVHPAFNDFASAETAFLDINRVVGGPLLFHGMAVILIVTNLGSGLTAQAGISRLLFGMGRDGILPRPFFAYVSPKRAVPAYNILLIGGFAFAGCLLLNYERAAELINFGAFLAFMGVNASVVRSYYFRRPRSERRILTDFVLPALGFLFCFVIWLNLSRQAKIVGALWFAAGILYDAIVSKGFRNSPAPLEVSV
jgi:amino acid transporter